MVILNVFVFVLLRLFAVVCFVMALKMVDKHEQQRVGWFIQTKTATSFRGNAGNRYRLFTSSRLIHILNIYTQINLIEMKFKFVAAFWPQTISPCPFLFFFSSSFRIPVEHRSVRFQSKANCNDECVLERPVRMRYPNIFGGVDCDQHFVIVAHSSVENESFRSMTTTISTNFLFADRDPFCPMNNSKICDIQSRKERIIQKQTKTKTSINNLVDSRLQGGLGL